MFEKKKSTASATFQKIQQDRGKKFGKCPNCKNGKVGNKDCIACQGDGKRWVYPGEKGYKK